MLADFLSGAGGWFRLEAWVWQAFVAVFVTLLASFAVRRVLGRWVVHLGRTANVWDDALVDSLRRPLRTLVWVVGIAFAAGLVPAASEGTVFGAVDSVRDVGVVACIAWFLVRFVSRVEANVLAPKPGRDEAGEGAAAGPDPVTVDVIAKLLRVSIVITSALVVLQTLGFSVAGVLAFGGVGGIAVGFAARDMLANFFGALMVFLDRPFGVGETVRSPDREIMGTVEHVGWRLTRIRTFENRPLYVPNSVFASIVIENVTRMRNRRIRETVGVRYDDFRQVRSIVDEVRTMLESHPEIDAGETLMVNFDTFGPSSLDFFIYAFTRTKVWAEYHAVKQDVLMKVFDIVERHGAEIAFPTTTVHLVGGGGAGDGDGGSGEPPSGGVEVGDGVR